jgi:hypothetical protein
MNQNLKRVVYLLTVSLVFFAHNAKSAELNFVSRSSQINALQPVQIDLVLNSGQEKFNAVSGEVVFSDESVSLLAIEDGRSVVNFWIDKPTASQGNRIFFPALHLVGIKEMAHNYFRLFLCQKKQALLPCVLISPVYYCMTAWARQQRWRLMSLSLI